MVHAQNVPFTCSATAGVPPTARAEGLAELMGDLTLNCTGGVATPAGQGVPQFTFTVLLTANVTSAPTAANQFSEALLLVDEPASGTNPSRPLLNCGNAGAPDSGGQGPGICSIISTGVPASNYDGTPNGFGAASCDGASGRPAPNNYGCGRPNAFQGRLGTPQSPGQLNAITFYNVPIDPPGAGGSRTIRITNVRANAASIGLATTFVANKIQATILASGSIPLAISYPTQNAAFLSAGLVQNPTSCAASGSSRVRVCEGFSSSWKSKNFAFAIGNQGSSGNTTVSQSFGYWFYAGGSNYPPDIAQNVPGAIYNTESSFEWPNNGVNAPPASNPPFGIGIFPVTTRTAPLNSVGYGAVNTGISQDGMAAAGTRIAFTFSGVPQGASVQVPQLVYLFPAGFAFDPTYTNGSSGVMILINTDSAGAGPFRAATSTTAAGNVAVYEVLWADPFQQEYAEVPYSLVNAPGGTTLQVTASLAPFYADAGSQQASANYPIPRFLANSDACGGRTCLTAVPDQATNSGPVQATFTYYGSQSLAGAQVLLRGTGVPDVLGLDVSQPAANAITATFDLGGAGLGARDIIISPISGPPVTVAGGFSVLQTPSCAYSVGPQSASFPASGGSGSLIVTASSIQCGWSASTNANWVTLSPVSASLPLVQPFTVAANSSASPLSGTISIAGQSITLTQEGASTCDYSISPGSTIFPVSGGTLTVNVTAQTGCAWTTVSSLGWVSFPGGSSGSGNGSVTIQVAANSGGLLSGTLTIAGQPFQVRQGASACGATDVSSQVTVTRRALLEPLQWYTQKLVITNSGPSVPGPVYVVMDGLCTGSPLFCPFANSVQYQTTTCQVPPVGLSPRILISSNGLAQNQTLSYDLVFSSSPYAISPNLSGGVQSGSVSIRVLSGTPNQ